MEPYYQDEKVTIYNADCREILPTLEKVDLLLTDPPYGILKQKGSAVSRRFNHNKGSSKIDWDVALSSKDCEMLKGSSEYQMIWGGNHFELGITNGWLIWDKQNDGLNFGECEFCWTNMKFAPRIHRERCINLIEGKRQHVTQKPVNLMIWCISFSPKSESILDPFMGSGTTLRAAKDLGKKAIGIEIDERYCEIAAKRMSQEVLNFN